MKKLTNLFASRYFVIFLLTFVNGLSMTMLFPVLPFIIKSYGQAEVVLGVLLGTFSLFQFLAAPILGSLSDMYGRKPILILTQSGTFLSWIVLGLAYMMPEYNLFGFILLPIFVVFLARMFDGITGGNASVAQAVLADLTETEERAKTFGMNGAVFGLALLVGPALGSLSIGSRFGFLGTGALGALISLVTLGIMIFALQESLPASKRKAKLKISFKEINVFSQIGKWGKTETIRYAIIMKSCMFFAFVGYTSIAALYLMDVFSFSASNIGFYLTFTGSFLIFHQAVSIRFFLKKYGDRKSLLIAFFLMGFGWIGMGLSGHIAIFTVLYFFSVMGISLGFTTLGALFSRSASASDQGEVMGMVSGLESLISVGVPIIITLLYTYLDFSIFLLLGCIPLGALCMSLVFFKNIEFPKN